MSIEPTVLKQLIELQTLDKTNLLSNKKDKTKQSDADFGTILQSVMQDSAKTQEDLLVTNDVVEGVPSAMANLGRGVMPQTLNQADYDQIIAKVSKRYGVDTALIKGVIHQESGFDPNAQSHAGAKGLMQLMDATAKGLGVTNSFDPQQNIEAGTKFLADLLRKYKGNEGAALAAYNAGPGRVDQLGITNDRELSAKLHLLPKETQGYVGKVLSAKQLYS